MGVGVLLVVTAERDKMSKTIRESLLDQIHTNVDPFEGFDASPYEWKDDPWNNELQTFFFDEGIPLVKPDLYVEFGSWFGRSARYVANLAWGAGIQDPCVMCIDTWLGSVEHWRGRARKRLGTEINHGYPNFYFNWLANMVNSPEAPAGKDYRDVVLPFPTTSANGARWLRQHGFKSSFIFVDGSHEYLDVYVDLVLAEGILPDEGGILVCDDCAHYFPGVERAIKKFMDERPGEYKWLKTGSVVTALVPTKRQDWIDVLEPKLKALKKKVAADKAAKRAAKAAGLAAANDDAAQ